MIFNTYTPKGAISTYIESIFHFKNFTPDHSIERVVPTGHVFIIFELDDFKRYTYDNESLKPDKEFSKVWISGTHKNYISISAHQNSEMFVVQFKPYGARPFLHVEMDAISNKVFGAEELLGDEILQIREELYQSQGSDPKFLIIENWLNKRFNENLCPDASLLQVIHALFEPKTDFNNQISEASVNYEHSQKHLIEEFKIHVGLTPKYFQRILRFNELLGKIQRKEKVSWSGISAECGYSDQSHFIKEFRHFSGFNPSEYLEEEYHQDEPNFFPLDRE